MTCTTVKGIVGKVVFFTKSTICVLANNADWDCFHNLWGWCSYLVTGIQEIGYDYTLHYIKRICTCMSFHGKHCQEILKKILDYLSTAKTYMALNSHTLYIDVNTVVNLKTKNACANLHHRTHLFHFIQLLYHPSTCKGPLLC